MSIDTESQPSPAQSSNIILRRPQITDGADIYSLIKACPPLDLNSAYAYLLLCHHFSDTCVVAHKHDQLVGFISGYIPPKQPDRFFVWQVAVHADARGCGLGTTMLQYLLQQPAVKSVRYFETTVSPSNEASRRMFARFARDCGVEIVEELLFSQDMFGTSAAHEDEMLLTIGPFN